MACGDQDADVVDILVNRIVISAWQNECSKPLGIITHKLRSYFADTRMLQQRDS
jgi:hypothetical protein